ALFDVCEMPFGTAPTDAIMETIYCVVACVDARIPFAVVGPAGCGKTNGFNIAKANMNKQKDFFRDLSEIFVWTYQVSLYSTDEEVRNMYLNAISRYTLQLSYMC